MYARYLNLITVLQGRSCYPILWVGKQTFRACKELAQCHHSGDAKVLKKKCLWKKKNPQLRAYFQAQGHFQQTIYWKIVSIYKNREEYSPSSSYQESFGMQEF